MKTEKTIVYFHTGRGGRFYNAGYTTFCGTKNIQEVLQIADGSGQWNFINKENYSDIFKKLGDRGNLVDLLEKCRDKDDFLEFENKTGLDLGEDVYTDSNGSHIITVEEVATGVGSLNWDNDYDTDVCMLLSDCDEEKLKLIIKSSEWNKEALLQEFFNDNTDLQIDWNRFSGDYLNLIEGYFNDPSFAIDEHYEN